MTPILRPHQQQDLDALRAEVHAGRNPVLVAPCGYGKGTLGSVIVNNAVRLGRRIIFAVHGKSLVVDMSERVAKLGIPHGVLLGGERRERWHPVQVASIDTLHRMEHPPEADLIIADECFPPKTLVTMSNSQKIPIDHVRCGDVVLNGIGLGTVTAVSQRLVDPTHMIQLGLADGSIVECTERHLFFTAHGWLRAQDLMGCELFRFQAMRALWSRISSMDQVRRPWQPNQGNVSQEMAETEILLEILLQESGESHEKRSFAYKNEFFAEEDRAQTYSERWEWATPELASVGSFACSGRGMGSGSSDSNWPIKCGRISEPLQGGYRQLQEQDWNRGGRAEPLWSARPPRQEEGIFTGRVRVENISRIERKGACAVFNLHVSGHPSYFANDCLVHNCHMALSPTWRKTIDRYPRARLIGFTATPIRLDGKGLGKATGGLFDSIVLGPSEEELIGLGHLVGSRVLAPPAPNLAGVHKTAGDFNQKQLSAACDKTKLVGNIVEHWKKYAQGKKTAAFGVDQAHAAHIAEQFNCAGVSFAYVDAETKQDERARIWKDLDTGSLVGVASVGCIAVGWDHPVVSCLVCARPTASLGLWRQMIGRGSRPNPGKDHFLILDHAGNTHRHAPYGMFEDRVPWSLDGAAIKDTGDKPPAVATCKHSYRWPDGRVQRPCYATFRAGPRECPFCGLPLRVVPRKVEVEAGELREVDSIEVRRKNENIMRSAYEGMLRHAQEKNYKPGWAGFAFKGKFGFWPPKSWATDWLSRELNREMALETTSA